MQKEELKNINEFLQEFKLDRVILGVIALSLIVHGLIHLLGFFVYWQITGDFEELTYKTTILFDTIDVGIVGIKIFGLVWILVTIGYVIIVINLVRLKNDIVWNQLTIVTFSSLFLTILDFTVAYAGALFNIIILTGLFIHYKRNHLTHP